LPRLEAIAEKFLNPSKSVEIPESTYKKNMFWAYENLRSGQYDISDLKLVCRGDENGVEVPCHAIFLLSCSPFFRKSFEDHMEQQKVPEKIVVDDATSQQMETILRFIYTGDLLVHHEDLIDVWFLSSRFQVAGLKALCEAMILSKIFSFSISDVKKIKNIANIFPAVDALLVLVCEAVLNKKVQFL
jgi:hypothetical protein